MKKILALTLISSTIWATTVTFKGEEVTLNSNGLKVEQDAPTFETVDKDFMEVK